MSPAQKSGAAKQEEKHEVTLEEALSLAQGHHQLGNFMLAERTFRDILRAFPNHYPTTQYLGTLLYQTGNYPEAKDFLEAAIEENGEDKATWNNYGATLTQLKDYENAIKAYDKALKIDSNQPDAMNNKANVLSKLGQYAEAEELSRKVLKINPENSVAYNNLGITLSRQVRFEEAVDVWEKAATLRPNDASVWANWSNSLREMGRLQEASEKGRKAVELDPKNPEALSNLANALRDLGKTDEAIALYRRATNERPEFHTAHYNLSIALSDNGMFEEASVAAKYAIAFKNDFAEAYASLSSALCQLGEYNKAFTAAQRSVHLKPDEIAGYLDLADILVRTDRLDDGDAAIFEALRREPGSPRAYIKLAEIRDRMNDTDGALDTIQKGIEISPDMPALWSKKASILFSSNNLDESLKAINQAIAVAPEWASAYLQKADILLSLDRNEEALELVRHAIKKNPKAPGPYFTLTGLKKFTSEDDEDFKNMQEAEKVVESYGLEVMASLNFAFADAYHDMKKYDKAFEYLKRANDIRRKCFAYSPEKSADSHEALKGKYTAPYFEHNKGKGYDSDVPVFIVGMPRSGTTLTEQILSSHPDVFGAGELPDMGIVHKLLAYEEMIDPKELGREYVRRVQERAKSDKYLRIVDKMPGNYAHIGLIATILPHAKIIHCRRNAIDTCLSCYQQNFARGQYWAYDFEELATEYKQYMALMDHWHKVLPGKILDVDYEETVNNTEAQARKLLDHIGLPWNDACLEPHKQKRAVLTASRAQVTQPIYKTSVEKWRVYEKQLEPLIKALGKT